MNLYISQHNHKHTNLLLYELTLGKLWRFYIENSETFNTYPIFDDSPFKPNQNKIILL